MNDRKLPIGIQSFEKIRNGNYLYVDKTEYIWNLIDSGATYFLSRPRRFGKSLLVSTIAAYFHGKKDLFKGLAIEKHENEKKENAWQVYPVIYFSLAGGSYTTEDGLYQALNRTLSKYEELYHVNPGNADLPSRFKNLIEKIANQDKPVVVLIDEYDKPLLDTMAVSREQENRNRQLYSDFFSVLKDEDQYIRFTFITGVTKFAKVSIFSGLNQPNDISMDDAFSGICGITQDELQDNFYPEIKKMAETNEQTEKECLDMLARKYDGYHFSKRGVALYNPFSILNAFYKKDYGRYWFTTGTPTFLVKMLEASAYYPEKLNEGLSVTEDILMDYRGDETDPIPLAYQSGYLTIRSYDREDDLYNLGFPNEEVEYGYLNVLAPSVLGENETDRTLSVTAMAKDLRKGKINSFLNRLQALFGGISYPEAHSLRYEQMWQNEIYLVLKLIGQRVYCQPHTSMGRADCVIETGEYIYILEFKLDQPAKKALEQISEKGYATPHQADKRRIYKIGVSFSSKKINIDDWEIDEA